MRAGSMADLLSSIRTVSIVLSRLQFARQSNLVGSTCSCVRMLMVILYWGIAADSPFRLWG